MNLEFLGQIVTLYYTCKKEKPNAVYPIPDRKKECFVYGIIKQRKKEGKNSMLENRLHIRTSITI